MSLVVGTCPRCRAFIIVKRRRADRKTKLCQSCTAHFTGLKYAPGRERRGPVRTGNRSHAPVTMAGTRP